MEIIKSSSIFELVTPQSLSLVVFRLNPHKAERCTPNAEVDELNVELANRLDARSDVFLTPSVLLSVEGKIAVLRIQTGGYLTTVEDILAVWQAVEEEGRAILGKIKPL